MKRKPDFWKLSVGCGCLGVLLQAAFLIGSLWVVIHFIRKIW